MRSMKFPLVSGVSGDIYASETERLRLEFSGGRVRRIAARESRTDYRVFSGGGVGFVSAEGAVAPRLAMLRSKELAPLCPCPKVELPGPLIQKDNTLLPETQDLTLEELEGLTQRLAAEGERLAGRTVTAAITVVKSQSTLVNSSDLRYQRRWGAVLASVSVSGASAGDAAAVWTMNDRLDDRNLGGLLAELEARLRMPSRRVPVPDDFRVPVLVRPGALRVLLSPLVMTLNGSVISENMGPFSKKDLGRRVLSPKISIYDDPSTVAAFQRRSLDDEGVCTQQLELVREGHLVGYYTDLLSASRLGMPPSGNGLRESPGMPPAPGLHALRVLRGGARDDELLVAAEEVLVLEELVMVPSIPGLESGFVAGLKRGSLFKRGKPVGWVSGTLEIPYFSTLNSLIAMGTEEAQTEGGSCLPSALFGAMRLT